MLMEPEEATFLNVSIADAKNFETPAEELFSELATCDGCALFECAGLVKPSGIDLMDCPLQLNLKLHVRRRLPEGAALLWHMVLPLAVISKNLLQPPHVWETWLGLLPANHSLDAHSPDMMFAQAVIHLLAKPDYPKLRLQFTYHNPELRAKMALQKQTEQERRQQQNLQAASYGQQRFQDLPLGLLEKRSQESDQPEEAGKEEARVQDAPKDASPEVIPEPTQVFDLSQTEFCAESSRAEEKLRETLHVALQGMSQLQSVVGVPATPVSLDMSGDPVAVGQLFHALHSRLVQISQGAQADEQNLADSLQYALLGTLDDFSGTGPAASGIAEPTSQLLAVRQRFPLLWPICRQVSKLANERVRLMEEIEANADGASVVQENAQLRTQLVETQERAREAEQELVQLRLRVSDLTLLSNRGQSPEIDLL
mmetsp:Transcript_6542/g.15108  ORF Transcript_6542/g.15108 Transcript_6542/m.15108 type:complete len:427 (-) Transcript_6542:37-1317(-)